MKSFLLCLAIIVLHFFQIIYFNQALFLEKYDVTYWKDRIEHSQWQLPLSKRIIGDEGFFTYVGYNLIKGASPDGLNAETPPFGKYLLGLSIVLFKNPYFFSFIFGIGSLAIFYYISNKLLNNKSLSLFITTLFFLDPLFFTQFWHASIDIFELFFLLLNFAFYLNIFYSKKPKTYALLSGLSLGFFTEVKPPILLPIVIALETGFLIFARKRKEIVIFILTFIVAILAIYTKYFLLHHSVIDFLKFQKYMVSFYLKSQLKTNVGAIWQALFFGQFPNIASFGTTKINEWWITWPIIIFLSSIEIIIIFFKKNTSWIWKGSVIFVLSTFLIYTFIPAYLRYILVVLPFLYLFSAKLIEQFFPQKIRQVIFIGLILYAVLHAHSLLIPSTDPILKDFSYNFSHQYFQDVYEEDLTSEDKKSISREQFRFVTQNAMKEATVNAITIEELARGEEALNKRTVAVKIIYKTQDLGEFSENKEIPLLKENNIWKIKWDWNLIFNNFSPNYPIETKIDLGKRGKIIDPNGQIIAQDSLGYIIYIDPEKIDRAKEEDMLRDLSLVSYQKGVHIQNAYLENILPHTSKAVATTFEKLNEKTKRKLLSYPGLYLAEYPSRLYKNLSPDSIKNTFYEECCTRIYSSYNYHGISGLEKQYDNILWGQSGGSILLKNNQGETIKTILKKDLKNGQDVIIQ